MFYLSQTWHHIPRSPVLEIGEVLLLDWPVAMQCDWEKTESISGLFSPYRQRGRLIFEQILVNSI